MHHPWHCQQVQVLSTPPAPQSLIASLWPLWLDPARAAAHDAGERAPGPRHGDQALADGGKRGCKRATQAWQFGRPRGSASWPEATAQHGWPSAVGWRDPGDGLQRGFGFTPGGPEPATQFGLLQQGSIHVAATLSPAATTTRRSAADHG